MTAQIRETMAVDGDRLPGHVYVARGIRAGRSIKGRDVDDEVPKWPGAGGPEPRTMAIVSNWCSVEGVMRPREDTQTADITP